MYGQCGSEAFGKEPSEGGQPQESDDLLTLIDKIEIS